MIPLRDSIRSHTTPVVNYTLLALNIGIFVLAGLFGFVDYEQVIQEAGLIPFQVTYHFGPGPALDFFTSMFLHGGLMHLAGNMLYLWIFGDNIEDAMGHGPYLIFYLLGGLVASTAHVLANPASTVPTVGASGAIAAVLGAYLVLYPGSRVRTLIPLGFFVRIAVLPAVLVLGFWFLLELFQGFLSLGADPEAGGVAFWAHIGGFAAGALLAKFFAGSRYSYGGENF